MRSSLWIVVLALLTQSSARVSKSLKEDAEKTGNVDVTKGYTLEALVADSNYTETEIYLSKLKEKNFEVTAATVTPIKENQHGTDGNGRILGGTDFTAATFVSPYTAFVFVQAFNPSGFLYSGCGGVILSPTWVLTAAHCVVLAADLILVNAGSYDSLPTTLIQRYGKAIIHPKFSLNFLINDIALVSLSRPFPLGATIGTALLSTVKPSPALDNIMFTTLGYGTASDDWLGRDNFLTVVDMQNMNKATCNAKTIGVFVEYPANTGCLSTAGGTKGICHNDEGGPVFYTPPAEEVGKIIGINSEYIGCPRQEPSSFTWIYPYIGWIHSTTLLNFT